MLVQFAPTVPADNRDLLTKVLADLIIPGSVTGFEATGTLHRYRFAMTGAKKASRVIALAPDIARYMGALHADIIQLDDDGEIEIALLTAPYISRFEVPGQLV